MEIDKEAAGLAKKAGINVKHTSFHHLTDVAYTSIVAAFEVLEHIDELRLCLQLIKERVDLKGFFGFTLPNYERVYNLPKKAQVKHLGQPPPPVHLNFFTIESVSNILEYCRFQAVLLRTRDFPNLNLKKGSTYQQLLKASFGRYHGPTILCVA